MRITLGEIKLFRSLQQKKFRQAERKFVIEGWYGLQEALSSDAVIELIVLAEDSPMPKQHRSMLDQIQKQRIPVREATPFDLKKITETVHTQGVAALVHQHGSTLNSLNLKQATLFVGLDAVSDPGNLGSIIRSADWFGADALLLGSGCVELYNEKVVRSTVGSLFHFPIVENLSLVETIAQMKLHGFIASALTADGDLNYHRLDPSEKHFLIFGSEAHGVSPEVRQICDRAVQIPRFGKAESLNVGVACGITLAQIKAIH
ncbi:MAG: RNA methyltransferase [bacterium]